MRSPGDHASDRMPMDASFAGQQAPISVVSLASNAARLSRDRRATIRADSDFWLRVADVSGIQAASEETGVGLLTE